MSRIRIKHFGPIKEGLVSNQEGWIDIKKVTIFIGNQGAGKSTIAKVYSTFSWIEKALVRGDYSENSIKTRIKTKFLSYHRLENYFQKEKTTIEYQGNAYYLGYKKGVLEIKKNKEGNNYELPQIMYVPAERNFITYVKTPTELKLSSPSLAEFLVEFNNSKNDLEKGEKMPINDTTIEYDRLNDRLNLKGNDYKLHISESSSGFQSSVPLYLVSKYLAKSVKSQSEQNGNQMSGKEKERFRKEIEEILNNTELTEEQRRIAISVLTSKFNKSAFINIVEEPEQNLFPDSQQKILYKLLEFNKMCDGNKLVVTTHSPYLINYLSLAVKANQLQDKAKSKELLNEINSIVPLASTITSKDLGIYQFYEKNGYIEELNLFDGIPSDDNFLNIELDQTNELFGRLLEIQQKL